MGEIRCFSDMIKKTGKGKTRVSSFDLFYSVRFTLMIMDCSVFPSRSLPEYELSCKRMTNSIVFEKIIILRQFGYGGCMWGCEVDHNWKPQREFAGPVPNPSLFGGEIFNNQEPTIDWGSPDAVAWHQIICFQ